jgi:hypothetical protein
VTNPRAPMQGYLERRRRDADIVEERHDEEAPHG